MIDKISKTITLQIKTLCYQVPVGKSYKAYINDHYLLDVSVAVNKKIYILCYGNVISRLSRIIDNS